MMVCGKCGLEKQICCKNLCKSCYNKNYIQPSRVCENCKETKQIMGHDLCFSCYSSPSRLCAWCNKIKKIIGNNLCGSCYHKQYVQIPRLCIGCNKIKKIGGANLCKSCYNKNYIQPSRMCGNCKEIRQIAGDNLCNNCYNKYYIPNRKRNDEKFAILSRLRNRLCEAFRQYSKTGKIRKACEYGIDYKAIINKLGPCPGNRNDYHIDHIKPLSSFSFDNLEEIKKAFAPENHQWLPAKENIKKGNKII